MKQRKFLIWIVVVVILFNLPPLSYILKENYTYSNIDGSFIYSEEGGKGFSYLSAVRSYAVFLSKHPDKDTGDNRLFRTFTFKPWYFWEWSDMIFHSDRFLLPYLDSAEVAKVK